MKWIPATWKDAEKGDFLKTKGVVFKVLDVKPDGTYLLETEGPTFQEGKPKPDGKIEIRTEFQGKPTPAASRLSGELPFPEIEAILKEKLDAELIAWKSVPEHKDARFVPWVTEDFGPKADVRTLASHLFICHGIETASGLKSMTELGPKRWAEQRASLLEAHEEAHQRDACERYDAPRRLPHVHHGAGKPGKK